jgi:excisionase family DNA binding protein
MAMAETKERQKAAEKREYLRVAEVAEMFHVSTKTVVRWASEGKLPHVLTLGGHRRFPRADIEQVVEGLHRGG